MKMLRKITEWYVSIIVVAVFIICAVVYFSAIKGLKQPAGLAEAFGFLFSSPKEYALCLLCGGLAKVAFTVMAVSAFLSLMCLFAAIINKRYDYDEVEVKDIVRYIANCVLAIILGIVQKQIIVHFWILLLVVVIIIGGFVLWTNDR